MLQTLWNNYSQMDRSQNPMKTHDFQEQKINYLKRLSQSKHMELYIYILIFRRLWKKA